MIERRFSGKHLCGFEANTVLPDTEPLFAILALECFDVPDAGIG